MYEKRHILVNIINHHRKLIIILPKYDNSYLNGLTKAYQVINAVNRPNEAPFRTNDMVVFFTVRGVQRNAVCSSVIGQRTLFGEVEIVEILAISKYGNRDRREFLRT